MGMFEDEPKVSFAAAFVERMHAERLQKLATPTAADLLAEMKLRSNPAYRQARAAGLGRATLRPMFGDTKVYPPIMKDMQESAEMQKARQEVEDAKAAKAATIDAMGTRELADAWVAATEAEAAAAIVDQYSHMGTEKHHLNSLHETPLMDRLQENTRHENKYFNY